MIFPSAFGSQIASIMDVLAKNAVAEISKLVEEESVVLHLEMRRKDSEIRDLQKNLEMVEAKLLKAQEAAVNRVKEEEEERAAAEGKMLDEDKKGDKTSELVARFSPCKPQNMMEEIPPISGVVKEEPASELPTTEIPADFAVAVQQYDSAWPPGCDTFGKNSAAMQQLAEILPFNSEEFSGGNDNKSSFDLFSTSKESSEECLAVPIKAEATALPITTGTAPQSIHGEVFRHETLQSVLQKSPARLPQTQKLSEGSSECKTVVVISRNNLRSKRQTNMLRSGQKLFVCSVCHKGFPRLSQLEEHKDSHQISKPFKCLECGKYFTQKTRLKTHQYVHTGERPFSCKICGKKFSRQDNCLRHERFHSGWKPHNCEWCDKSFTSLGNLKIHQEIHQRGR